LEVDPGEEAPDPLHPHSTRSRTRNFGSVTQRRG
jgi:hypothetical protein